MKLQSWLYLQECMEGSITDSTLSSVLNSAAVVGSLDVVVGCNGIPLHE